VNLLASDELDGVAQYCRVVQVEQADTAHDGIRQGIGGIQPAAESNLDNCNIDFFLK
jgi:hypothetical protein